MAPPIVLVIDDDVANLRVFQRVFRSKFTILVATSWPQAVELLRDTTPDVAFVDFSMPRMNGLGVLAELRRVAPRVARYLLTGYGDLPEIAAADPTLCTRVLGKPWERVDIEAAVAASMG